MSAGHVFVVVGVTGEYSDRNEWFVAAHTTEEAATKHADDAKLEAHRIEKIRDEAGYLWKEKPGTTNPHDPKMDMDYTGTDYFVAKVPLIEP